MLCIDRQDGESVRIGEAVILVRIRGGKVRLLIDAPPQVRVLRTELDGKPRREQPALPSKEG